MLFLPLLLLCTITSLQLVVYSISRRFLAQRRASLARAGDPEKSVMASNQPIQTPNEKSPIPAGVLDHAVSDVPLRIVVLGAGVVGLTTACELQERYPAAQITIVAEYFPTDSLEDLDGTYCSAWVCIKLAQ